MVLGDYVIYINGKAQENFVEESAKYFLINAKFISSSGLITKKVTTRLSPALKDDITIVLSDIPNGQALAKCFFVDNSESFTVNQRIAILRAKTAAFPKYLFYLLNRHNYFLKFNDGVNQTNLKKSDIINMPVSLPPLPEQKKIAEILSTWDEAIEFNEKLLDTEKQQKRVYVSYIYTKRHVTDIENVKKFEKLGKHLVEKTERNKDELINDVLSVTNTRGFVLQSAQFEREIASKDKKNYKVVRKDQFAYNPSRVNVGSIDQLSERDSGIISPMYVVFQCKDSIKGRYLYHFLKSDYFLRLIPRFTQGSVRDSLSFDGLCEMKIHIPSIDKQTKYSQLLDSLDIKIKLIERNIEYLKTQKQGLMQRLLTGKVSVKLD